MDVSMVSNQCPGDNTVLQDPPTVAQDGPKGWRPNPHHKTNGQIKEEKIVTQLHEIINEVDDEVYQKEVGTLCQVQLWHLMYSFMYLR